MNHGGASAGSFDRTSGPPLGRRQLSNTANRSSLIVGPFSQDIELGLHRSDYMIHAPEGSTPGSARLYQVEINTIASSFSSLSSKVSDLHRFLFKRVLPQSDDYRVDQLPENRSMVALPAAMAKAFELYGNPNATLLLVCQPSERNAFDQRWIEYQLFEKHGIRVLRRSLTEIGASAEIRGEDRRLFVDGEEVAVVYYRAGYTPVDYPSEKVGCVVQRTSVAIVFTLDRSHRIRSGRRGISWNNRGASNARQRRTT